MLDGSVDEKVIIFRVDINSSVHIDNKGKDILILDKDPTQGVGDTALPAKAQYSINFSRSNRKFCSSLHFNGSNSFLFVNAVEIYQFRAKDSKIIKASLLFMKYFRRFFSQ